MANDVRQSGEDRKWSELSKLLQDDGSMFGAEGEREKLIIFTEHRDTLRYLQSKISSLLGSEDAVVTIHGGLLRDERRKVEERFKQDKEVRILIATDAAGEGINLQRAHLMVNYDLPWNPNGAAFRADSSYRPDRGMPSVESGVKGNPRGYGVWSFVGKAGARARGSEGEGI